MASGDQRIIIEEGLAVRLRRSPRARRMTLRVPRDGSGAVRLTLRSLTRAAPSAWAFAFPALLVVQRFVRRRYRRALVRSPS